MIGIGIPISHRRMPRMISPLFLTPPKRQRREEVPGPVRQSARVMVLMEVVYRRKV